MKIVPNQRWSRKLSWLAAHPRRAAILATLLLSSLAALVRAPAIEGSMIDRISGAGESLQTAREIQAATGNLTMAAVIVTPADISIEEGFASLAALRARLGRVNSRTEVESIDSVSEQLFLYGLSSDDRLESLLHKLAGSPGASVLIGRDLSRFLVAITFPEDAGDEVIGAVMAHPWADVAEEHRIVASAQLEKDIARSLTKDLWLLIPAIIVTMLTAIMFAFGGWRAGLLPAFTSAASTVVTFGLFSLCPLC